MGTVPDALKPHQFKKGQSGNPSGRPKGTLKDYVGKKLRDMSEEEKDEFLKKITPDIQWKMSEGNPHQSTDSKVEVTLPTPIILLDNVLRDDSNKKDNILAEEN